MKGHAKIKEYFGVSFKKVFIMKQSKFNSRISVTDATDLLYNAYSDRFMLIRHDAEIPTDERAANIGEYVKGGFVVTDGADEVEAVKKMSLAEDLRDDKYMLIVNPTLGCNFNCWYCYEQKSNSTEMPEETLRRVKRCITYICTHFKKLELSFFGGEPLLKFTDIVRPLIDHASKESKAAGCGLSLSFTTNGSLITSSMIDYFEGRDVYFQITLDGGRSVHDDTRHFKTGKGSYEVILNNICRLLKHRHGVRLRVNYTDKNVDTIADIADDVTEKTQEADRKYLCFSLHQVWQNTSVDLSEAVGRQKDAIMAKGFQVLLPLFDNVRSSCYGDKKNSMVVNYNGDLYKCTAVDFMNVKREGYLAEDGRPVWEDDSLNKRLSRKFTNKPCLECRILPICNGSCTQKYIYNEGHDFCVFGYSDKKKDEAILRKFERYIENVK